MRITLALSIFILISAFTFGQTKENDKNFNIGIEAFNSGNYEKAISYFTLSINELSTTNAIINRAISYYYMGDSCNFCTDLKRAYGFGDTTAREYYKTNCIKSSWNRVIPDSIKPENPDAKYLEVTYSKYFRDSLVMVYFHNGGRIWWKTISDLPDNAYTIVEIMPQFRGGDQALMKYLDTNLEYPTGDVGNRIQGSVIVQYIVATNGAITNVKVLKGIGGRYDEAAVKVVSGMPKWIPGQQNGKPVRVKFNISIPFSVKSK